MNKWIPIAALLLLPGVLAAQTTQPAGSLYDIRAFGAVGEKLSDAPAPDKR